MSAKASPYPSLGKSEISSGHEEVIALVRGRLRHMAPPEAADLLSV
jgi:hypothetical protein